MLADIASIRQRLAALGASPCHEDRVLRLWSRGLAQDTPGNRPGDHLPARVKAQLSVIESEFAGLARLSSAHPAADGAERLRVALAPDNTGSMPSSASNCFPSCV